MNNRVSRTLAILLLPAAMTGCASLHHKPVAAAPPPPQAPDLSQSPLYSPEMNETSPRLPSLPTTSDVAVVRPPPPPEKPHHAKKTKPVKGVPAPKPAGGEGSATPAETIAADAPPGAGSTVEKKPPVQQASNSAAEAPANVPETGDSPIGELTTGSFAESAQTSHQAEDLVKSTREGVEGIRRSLSPDEKKTVAELWTFLNRAQQALKNGDVDGAYGLATKAKLLLDELTQK